MLNAGYTTFNVERCSFCRSTKPRADHNFPYLDKFGNQNLSLFRDPSIKWTPNHDLINLNPPLIADYSLILTVAHRVDVERSIFNVQCRMLGFQAFYDGFFLSPTFLFWMKSKIRTHASFRGSLRGQSRNLGPIIVIQSLVGEYSLFLAVKDRVVIERWFSNV